MSVLRTLLVLVAVALLLGAQACDRTITTVTSTTTTVATATTTTPVVATDPVAIMDTATITDITVLLTNAKNAVAGLESLFAQPMFTTVDAHANGDVQKGNGGRRRQKRRDHGIAVATERLGDSSVLRIDGGGMRLPSGSI